MAYPLSTAEVYYSYRAPGLLLEDCDLSCTVYDDGDIKVDSVCAPGCKADLLTSTDDLLRKLGERIALSAIVDEDLREEIYECANVRAVARSQWAPVYWEAAE